MDARISSLNEGWYFNLTDDQRFAQQYYDHSSWQQVRLPHDWMVTQSFNNRVDNRTGWLEGGIGWYRRTLYLAEVPAGHKYFFISDGIYRKSTVYINGKIVGTRPYGTINFEYEISKYLEVGVNTIAIRVDTSQQASARWYTGSGINRNIDLRITHDTYIPTGGLYLTTPQLSEEQAQVACEIAVIHDGSEVKNITMCIRIKDQAETCLVEQKITEQILPGEQIFKTTLIIKEPQLWDLDSPNLYTCEVTLLEGEKCLESVQQRFGIRTIVFKPHEGFFLNNQTLKFKGVCLHNDCGVVGTAVPKNIWEKRIRLLKEMGCNAIRTAHHPFPSAFYEVCDTLGMMVMNEIFDGWEAGKAPYDYGLDFEKWHEKDIEQFVKRDRNHPCVMLWSIGNEVHGMKKETTQRLQDCIHQWDQTRLVTCGIQGTGQGSDENRAVLEVAGYNDGGGACFIYERDHERRPDQLFIATEAPHSYHTRGFYRTQTWWRDKNQPRIEIENLTEEELFFDGNLDYHSSYDNAGVRTCARDSWSLAEQYDYLCGEFRWTGFDYYGESFGWPSRFVANGVIDTANFVKDHYYLYQSMWTKEPMIHCLPHWTHRGLKEGTLVPVWVYTNCEEAEVFLEGKSLGKQRKETAKHLAWQVPYYPGRLEVKGYCQGQAQAYKCYQTATAPAQLQVTQEHLVLEGEVVEQISVAIQDEKGELVPHADATVSFLTEGNLSLIGTENGNSVDLTPITSHTKKAFNGLVAGYIRSKQGDLAIGRIYVVSVLGESYFTEQIDLIIDVKCVTRGVVDEEPLMIYYTLDGEEPNLKSNPYYQPIPIEETTWIRVALYKGGLKIGEHSSLFVKGEREKVMDLLHGNKVLQLERPLGPFAKQIIGKWREGESLYAFHATGELVRYLNEQEQQLIGYWWYDFPVDYFEAQDYAGTGEIWFVSGEKQIFNLKTQAGKILVIDNEKKGFSTAYGSQGELIWTKEEIQ